MAKKRKLQKCLLIIVGILTLIIISVGGYLIYLSSLNVTLPIASHNLSQRKLLTKEDLTYVTIPKRFLNDDLLIDEDAIVGRYIKLGHAIAKGSPFYKQALEVSTAMSDYAHVLLNEGEATYDFAISEIKANPAHLKVGMRVDLYLTINDEVLISDILLKDAMIIGLYDGGFQPIKEYVQDVNVAYISLAVKEKDIAILNQALLIGQISLSVKQRTYTADLEPLLAEDSRVYPYLHILEDHDE